MINKIRILFLLLTLGVCTVSSVTYAAECSEEVKQDARQKAKDAAKESFNRVKTDAEAYNKLAQQYLNQCDAQVSAGTPVGSSEKAISAASQAGIKLDDPAIHQYRNISWIGPTAMGCSAAANCSSQKIAECKQTAAKASDALIKLNNSIHATEQKLYATTNEAMTNCQCDENGTPDCSVVDQNADEVEAEGGECQITGFLNTLSACPLCPVFEVVMKTNADIAHLAWEATAEPLSQTVGIFFLVLLALEVLKAIASVGGTKPSAIIKSVLVLCLKFGITLGLLSNSHYIYGLFISPITQGSLELGLAVAQSSGGTTCAPETVSSISSQEISPELFNSVIGTVQCFSKDAATMPAIGMGLLCIQETFSMLLSGLIILFFGIMIWLAFSFYLIDATVQLGMLCALVPLLIACWPFGMTKQYTAKGVKMLMNTFFTFAFAGVLIMLASSYVTAAVTGGGASSTGDLINAINNNDHKSMETLASIESISVITLISCCVFAMKMITHVSGLANQFSSGSGMSYGAKLGGMATSAATGAAKWAGGKAKKLAGAGLKAASDKTGLTAAAKKGMGAVQRGWGKTWAGAGAAVGLGRFQNRNVGSATQEQGTEQEKGREAAPEDKKNGGNDNNENNTTNNNNNADNNNGGNGNSDGDNNTTNNNDNGGNGNSDGDNNTTNNNDNGGNDNSGGNNGGNGNSGGDNNTTNNNNNGGNANRGGDNNTTNNNNNTGSNNGGDGNSGGDNNTANNNNNAGSNNGGNGNSDGDNNTTNNNDNAGNANRGGDNNTTNNNDNGSNNGGDNGGTSGGGSDGGSSGGDNGGASGGGSDGGSSGGDNNTTNNNNNAGNNNGGNGNGNIIDSQEYAKVVRMEMLQNAAKGQDSDGNKFITTSDGNGSYTQSKIGSNGKTKSSTTVDKDGNVTDRLYHNNGKLKSIIHMNADGSSSFQSFDKNGNPIIKPKNKES